MLFSEKKSHNHAVMRCKTSTRNRMFTWYYVLCVDMRWVVNKLKGALAPQSKKEPSSSGHNNEQPEPLDVLTNEELVAYGTALSSVTLLENELLQRLEIYVAGYGDFLVTDDDDPPR